MILLAAAMLPFDFVKSRIYLQLQALALASYAAVAHLNTVGSKACAVAISIQHSCFEASNRGTVSTY